MNDLPVQQKLIDIGCDPVASLLDLLLKDKSTHKNIIWATDTYESLGHGFTDKEQIDKYLLLQHADIIKPRIQKSLEAQAAHSKVTGSAGSPDAKKSGSLYSGMAVQPDE